MEQANTSLTDRSRPSAPGAAFALLWLAATAAWLWLLLGGRRGFDLVALALPLLLTLACTVALLRWLPIPEAVAAEAPATHTRRGRFALAVALALALLAVPYALLDKTLIFVFPLAALATIALLRLPVPRRTLLYALPLALLAGFAGLGAGWLEFRPAEWALLQVALVIACLPAGWGILEREGLLGSGAGASLFLTRGAEAALRGFVAGAALAAPWALMNVVSGDATRDAWATQPWAPLVAIQPGIAEEAWGRVFLVSLLYLWLRRFGRHKTALTAAVLLAGYWFAYLHTDGGPEATFSTLLIGTYYSLPISYLWLRRGYETAVGFHFCVDCVRFTAAYLANL